MNLCCEIRFSLIFMRNRREESQKCKMTYEEFSLLLSSPENKAKIESFMKKRNSTIWANFFKEELPSKSSEPKEKPESLTLKSENVSQNAEPFEHSNDEQIMRKTSSFGDLKGSGSLDQMLGLGSKEPTTETKPKFFPFEADLKFQCVSSLFQEKKESSMNNYFTYLKIKHENKRKTTYLCERHFRCRSIALTYELHYKKITKNKGENFKFCLKSTTSAFLQHKKMEFLPYVENKRKAQNFKLKKNKEKKKEPLQIVKSRIQRIFDSSNIILESSLDNSSNNDSLFMNTEEDNQSVSGLDLEKKNTGFSEKRDAEELIFEEIKTKLATLMKPTEKIDNFFVVTLLKKTELFLSFLVFSSKRLYLFINTFNNKERQGDLDKYVMIKKGTTENLKDFSLDLNFLRVELLRKSEISEIHIRRYLLQVCALEIFSLNRNYFLICGKENINSVTHSFLRFLQIKTKKPIKPNTLFSLSLLGKEFRPNNITKILKKRKFQIIESQEVLKILTPLWEEGKISNFAYLMVLNLISGRTYSDLSQYPVFPWVIGFNEEANVLDLNEERNFRNLAKPMGALNEEKAKSVREHYYNILNTLDTAPFHYGSHYSNPVVILYYLIRLMPYSEWAKDLQGGKFDLGDRIFNNICYTCNLSMTYDCKELIPELFFLPELFLNLNDFDFGFTQGKIKVDDVILPKWTHQNPRFLTNANRKALESPYVHSHLNEWIDLIFGFKQQGDAAIESLNVFYPLTYENSINLDEIADIKEKNCILDQISEYGQTPKQLFKKPHPEKKKTKKIKLFLYNPIFLKNLKATLLVSWKEGSQPKERLCKYNDFCVKSECDVQHFENMKGLSSFISKKEVKLTGKDYQNSSVLSPEGSQFYGNFSKFVNFDNCYKMLLLFEGRSPEIKYLKYWSFPDEIPSAFLISNGKRHLLMGDVYGSVKIYRISKKSLKAKTPANFYDLNLIKLNKPQIKEDFNGKSQSFSFRFNGVSYEAKESLSPSTEKLLKKASSKNSESKKPQNFEIRSEQKKSLKFHFSKINASESLRKPFRFQSLSSLREEILCPKREFLNFYDLISVKRQKEAVSREQKKGNKSIEFISCLNIHMGKITAMEMNYSLSLLISCDDEGVVCISKIENPKLLQKIHTYHFVEQKIFREICFFEWKEFKESQEKRSKLHKRIALREKIKGLSICQENGDFLVFSKSYISIYSVNGVLVTILNRRTEKLPKFSAALLISNRDTFEDNYILTGHKDGKVYCWIIKPTQILEVENPTRNVYQTVYSRTNDQKTLFEKVLVPFKMFKIHFCGTFRKDFTSMVEEASKEKEKNSKKIVKIAVSNNQKRMYTLNNDSELFQWEIIREAKTEKEENPQLTNETACFMCGEYYGIFDRKQCICCYNFMCEKCAGRCEIFIYERSLRKKEKVCEQCYLKRMDKKITGLYDHY